jgi:myo-inositol-1-phosphate synthase
MMLAKIAKVTKKKAKDGVVEFRITYTKDVKTYKQNQEIKPFEFLEGMNLSLFCVIELHLQKLDSHRINIHLMLCSL